MPFLSSDWLALDSLPSDWFKVGLHYILCYFWREELPAQNKHILE